VSLSPDPIGTGIFLIPVTAHFTCSDALSGIDLCPADQVITTPGVNRTVTGTAFDRAGNSSPVTTNPFTAVRAVPTITVALTPAANANGWRSTPVVAHFTCTELDAALPDCP